MKEGFVLLTELSEAHNQIHRNAFNTPETTYLTSVVPTIASLKLGEMRIYNDGTDFWLYCKLSKDRIGKIKFTII